MLAAIITILVFFTVIFLHEFGHFTAAKLSDVKVNEFSIGMGPKIFSKSYGETSYSLRALPIGGFVAMEGEEENSDDLRAFNNVSPIKQMIVIVAGALMNMLLAILAFTLFFAIVGTPSTTIGEVLDNSPAYYAGLKAKDKILEINKTPVKSWEDIIENISKADSSTINLKIERDKEILNIESETEDTNGRKTIGINYQPMKNAGNVLKAGLKETKNTSLMILKFLKELVTFKQDVSELMGPVGVAREIGKASQLGIIGVLYIIGAISANLGIFNMLPIPALDGGRFLMILAEAISGKKIPEKIAIGINAFGFVLLFGLMIYVTIFNDIFRMGN
ncbi:MAG: RIP metalloprotease RseP [Tissierellia bacterium]|nr:RIP metalloprotease RseP [Tissierellia bacterium]